MASQLQNDLNNIENNIEKLNELAIKILNHTPLPSYIELEYIQGTGTQYLNTKLPPKSSYKVEMTFQINTVTGYERLWGVSNNGAPTRGNVWGSYGSSNFFVIKHGTTYSKGQTLEVTINTATKYTLIVDYSSRRVYLNNSLLGSYSDNLSSTTNPMYIFQGYGSDVKPVKGNLYNFRIYDNNILLMDLIPVKRRSDNVICMYDTISNTFFTNTGTETFIAGPEKN